MKQRLYGLEPGEYARRYEEQEGICPLCQEWFAVLDVDHCHTTERVRGLLCRACNRRVGHIEDRDWLKRALEYLG